MIVRLPFPLPTWNRLLAMHHWERKKLRDWIHHAVSISIRAGTDSLTPMESAQRLQSTGLSLLEYYQMIRPNASRKSLLAKRKSDHKRSRKR